MSKFRDEYGQFEVLGSIEEKGYTIEYRRYDHSPRIKTLGGQYVLCVEELKRYRFARNDHMAMHGLPKFCKELPTRQVETP